MAVNCIIAGVPRSGTSMTAGLFAHTDYCLGDDLLPPSVSNPLGYFEDRGVNTLNNLLIDRLLCWPWQDRIRKCFAPLAHTDRRLYPSAAPRRLRNISIERPLYDRMRTFIQRQPFLLKDPRFCVTLPYWQTVLPDTTKYVIVFRDPFKVAESYIKNGKIIYGLDVPAGWPFHSYAVNYARLLRLFAQSDTALFVHYEQILSGTHVKNLCDFLETTHVNADHPIRELSRSQGQPAQSGPVPVRPVRAAVATYLKLCDAAAYTTGADEMRTWRHSV
jgi:hypothetical protein